MSGHHVSHAHNKTRRTFLPNLHTRRYFVESLGTWVTLKLSTKGIRIIDQQGIERVWADIKQRASKR